ncbi:uncharacterized protein LODBEIA_P17390 [Lodderomyces beijingensis]|uniref:rRNA biogenesis protein RRP36 n=1 Tax=Lodderomyces beijingensis TaxID=1775926 RepID=A0ABP0ZML9_9ASCO
MTSSKMPKRDRIRRYTEEEDEEEEEEQDEYLKKSKRAAGNKREDDDDDEMSRISFGALNRAQLKINREAPQEQEADDDDEEEDEFFSDDSQSDSAPEESTTTTTSKKRGKHAPAIASSKKPVSRIREIPGLPSARKTQSLHSDIRFDAAYGKADMNQARKNYAFLDEYRKQEIAKMETILKDPKSKLNPYEKEELKLQLQSLKSRMDTLQTRDLQNSILREYKKKSYSDVKSGKSTQPHFLKRSDKRKILQKAKFDSMKPQQREKAMERKRKRRLGKEFKQLEFRSNNN